MEQVVTGRKKESRELRRNTPTKQLYATYHSEKEKADAYLEFFPGSNMLVRWV